jgi:hypothetical protein
MEIYTDEFTGLKYIDEEDFMAKYGDNISEDVQYLLNGLKINYIYNIIRKLIAFNGAIQEYEEILSSEKCAKDYSDFDIRNLKDKIDDLHFSLQFEYSECYEKFDKSYWKYLPIKFEDCFYDIFDKKYDMKKIFDDIYIIEKIEKGGIRVESI